MAIAIAVALIGPLGATGTVSLVVSLVVRSGRRDCLSLRLGAQAGKQVRSAGARSRVVDSVLADRVDLGWQSDTQPLGVETRAASAAAKARARCAEAGRRETVIVVEGRHLSYTASVKAHVRDRGDLECVGKVCRKSLADESRRSVQRTAADDVKLIGADEGAKGGDGYKAARRGRPCIRTKIRLLYQSSTAPL